MTLEGGQSCIKKNGKLSGYFELEEGFAREK